MSNKSPEVNEDLPDIRDRLERDKALRSLLGNDLSPEDRLKNDVLGIGSKVAKAEHYVAAEAMEQIRRDVGAIRAWLWENGEKKPYFSEEERDCPNYNPELDKNVDYYVFDDNGTSVMAIRNQPSGEILKLLEDDSTEIGSYLSFNEYGDSANKTTFEFDLGFSGMFEFRIIFPTKVGDHNRIRYHSGKQPLEKIDEREARIIQSVLKDFINATGTNQPTNTI